MVAALVSFDILCKMAHYVMDVISKEQTSLVGFSMRHLKPMCDRSMARVLIRRIESIVTRLIEEAQPISDIMIPTPILFGGFGGH